MPSLIPWTMVGQTVRFSRTEFCKIFRGYQDRPSTAETINRSPCGRFARHHMIIFLKFEMHVILLFVFVFRRVLKKKSSDRLNVMIDQMRVIRSSKNEWQ